MISFSGVLEHTSHCQHDLMDPLQIEEQQREGEEEGGRGREAREEEEQALNCGAAPFERMSTGLGDNIEASLLFSLGHVNGLNPYRVRKLEI